MSSDPTHAAVPNDDVERAGPDPPDTDGIEAAAASLLDAADPVDGVRLVRLALVDDTSVDEAREVLSALDVLFTVVGSTLPEEYDPATSEVDVLVETDQHVEEMASTLESVDRVDGVVIADVTLPDTDAEDAPDVDHDGLSIYRLDDHLLVTDDFGALVERFHEELHDIDDLAALEETVESVDGQVTTLDDRLDGVEERLDEVADGTESTVEELRGTVDELASEVETVEDELENAADAGEVESLWYHVETEVPAKEEIEYIFAPAAERIDEDEVHPNMRSVVQEVDEELRRTYALREAGFVDRLRWLLRGELPPEP